MPTLDRDARCGCCLKPMSAGEEFRWHTRSGRQVSRTQRTKDRHFPAHVDILCSQRDRMAEDAARAAMIEARAAHVFAEMTAGRMTPTQGVAYLSNGTVEVAA